MEANLKPNGVLVSVIIPTHHLSNSLQTTLSAINHQTYPYQSFEVLVVTDRITDEFKELINDLTPRLQLRLIEQAGPGPGIRRNQGAGNANGKILIFIDDDIQATPQLIEAHVSSHQSKSDQVVIGYFPPIFKGEKGYFRMELWDWWEDTFLDMAKIGHRFTYRDLLSGNFSIHAELFRRVGGFDPRYTCRDDYELGMRLIEAGAEIRFCREAMGYHRDRTDFARLVKRKHDEGFWDCELGRQHPELRSDLMMNKWFNLSSLPSRIFRYMAFKWTNYGDSLIAGLISLSNICKRMQLRALWQRFFIGLQIYSYWRGVAVRLRTLNKVEEFLNNNLIRNEGIGQELIVDISKGVSAAEFLADQRRPQSICVQYHGQHVGVILHEPGAERLRGVHLRSFLATDLAESLIKSMIIGLASGSSTQIQEVSIAELQIPTHVDID